MPHQPLDDDVMECLMVLTAEMLGLPAHLCGKRHCRRDRRCHYWGIAAGAPHCLADLTPEQRRAYDALFAAVVETHGFVMADAHWLPSPDPELRELEEASLDVATAAIGMHRPNRRPMRRWLQAQRDGETAAPAPDASA